jgi:hypothetical protein
MRPDPEDRKALDLLLKREDLTEWQAELVERLNNASTWNVQDGVTFDEVWEQLYG